MKIQFFGKYQELMQDFLDKIGNPDDFSATQLADRLYSRFEVEDVHLADDSYYYPIWDYFKNTVIPHKVAVYQAGIDLMKGAVVKHYQDFEKRLVYHDFSKFSCAEHIGYVLYNFKDKSKNSDRVKSLFDSAWHHHKMNNDHHPEYWLSVSRDGSSCKAIEMDFHAMVEMICDWIGAGKTYGSSLEDWLPGNIGSFLFHPATAVDVSALIGGITGNAFSYKDGRIFLVD